MFNTIPKNTAEQNPIEVAYHIETKTYEELSRKPKFNNALAELLEIHKTTTPNFQGKSVMEERYGFTIDSTSIKEISYDKYTSWTFLIHRENPDKAFFENLVVEVDSTDDINAYLVKYIPKSAPVPYPEHDSFSLDASIEAMQIEYNPSGAKITAICLTVTTIYCNWGGDEHVAGPNCTESYMYEDSTTTCYSVGGGGYGGYGGDDGGGDPPGSDGGGGAGDGSGDSGGDPPPEDCHGADCGPELITVPVLPVENDCQNLKALSDVNGQNINDQIDFLKTKLDEQNSSTNPHEWGVMFKRELNGDGSHACTNTPVEGTAHGVNLIKGWDYIGGAHIHTPNGYGMYSFGDLVQLAGFYNYASADNLPYVVSIMICNNPVYETDPTANPYIVYALKANNPSLLIAQVNNMLNSPLYYAPTKEQKMKKILAAQAKGYEDNKNNLERYFLQVFGTFGVDLYKAVGDMSNWNKLSLNGTTVESIPCN
ncbi:MAG TPA: hypothetical protein VFM65_03485 [Flavobacteriaceae bacterium]|nr:hypothetical protein [Flavobacteriaceae bacterium]